MSTTPQRSPSKESYGSGPDLSNTHLTSDIVAISNITMRQEKRKRGDMMEEDWKTFMAEIKKMIKTSNDAQNQKFTILQSTIDEIKQQNNDISKSMDFISQKYDELCTRLEKYEKEKSQHLKYIKTLETRVEQLDRNARNSSIEIRNIPRNNLECKEDLIKLVKNIGTSIKVDITDTDIKDIYRYSSKTSTQMPITVEFSTVLKKQTILKMIKQHKQDTKSNLSTEQAKISGPKEPIYISDCLTAQSKKLFAMARKFASENQFKFCWTNHGLVYLRKEEGSKAVRICSEEDFHKLSHNI